MGAMRFRQLRQRLDKRSTTLLWSPMQQQQAVEVQPTARQSAGKHATIGFCDFRNRGVAAFFLARRVDAIQ